MNRRERSARRRQQMTPRRRLERRILSWERRIERTERVQDARRALLRKLKDPSTPHADVLAIIEFYNDQRE